MPYYEQIGGSCVLKCAQMLLKYIGKNIQLSEILSSLNASDSDFGIDEYKITYSITQFLSQKTGFLTYVIPYFGIAHLKWKALSELDKGHPVLLSWGNHAVVILGYRENGEKIILHDPQNISPANNDEGTMYTIRDWDWIKNRHKVKTEKYIILFID